LGGPIQRDKLWFYGSARWWTINAGTRFVHNGRLGPVGAPVIDEGHLKDFTERVTWQVTPKNKLSAFYTREGRQRAFVAPFDQGFTQPEAADWQFNPADWIGYVKWTAALSNKLLIEGGFAPNSKTTYGIYQQGTHLIPGAPADACNDGCGTPVLPY